MGERICVLRVSAVKFLGDTRLTSAVRSLRNSSKLQQAKQTVYSLDEPATGLHLADIVRGLLSEEGEIFFPAIRCALGLTRFSLIGHSVGGAMAIVIAALHREGCEAVITEAAQAFVEPLTLSSISATKEQFSAATQFARIAKWHGENARWVVDAWTGVWLSPEFLNWNLDQHLAQIKCPVLAIHGELDEYGSLEFPRRITSGVSGLSEMAILDNCGHVPHRERKEEVLRLVSTFLARLSK